MADSVNSTVDSSDNGNGLADILSMALEKSGFDTLVTPTEHSEPIISDSFPASDVTELTNDIFSAVSSSGPISEASPLVSDTLPLLLTPSVSGVEDNDAALDLVESFGGLEPSPDLSALLDETSSDFLDSLITPTTQSHVMSTPIVPPRTSKLNLPQTTSAAGAGLKHMASLNVSDVLSQLGLEAPSVPVTPSKSFSIRITPGSVTEPLPVTSIAGMIGSVSVTHIDSTLVR